MKKYIITLAIALGFGMNVNAQIGEYNKQYSQERTDGFFTGSYDEFREDTWSDNFGTMPSIIGHGYQYDQSAPLGSGLLLLAGMAFAYGRRKRN